MARTRIIKPGFFKNEELAECSAFARLLFAGLWTLADREGRLEDRPKRIKADIFPYDNLDCDALLNELSEKKFLVRYKSEGQYYIQIVNFVKHQQPHHKEIQSVIPSPVKVEAILDQDQVNDDTTKSHIAPLDTSYLILDTSTTHRAREPFTEIYETGSEVFPVLATRNTSIIHEWLKAGAIPADAIGEIRRAHADGKDIKSWSYFTGGVMDAVKTRNQPLAEGRAREGPKKSMSQSAREAAARAVQNMGGLQ